MRSITYPEFLGRYRTRQKIGEGGYGQVFRVFDCETKSFMALKKIVLRRNEDPLTFLREIQIQAFLAHPLVLKAHDRYFGHKIEIGIISELGKVSLQRLIKDKTEIFPIEEIINFAFHFTKLFASFQDQNIVHRDIKPDNFVQVGPGLNCKLIDFGLCTHVNDITGAAGSFAYMSPKLKKMHTNKELKNHIKSNPYKNDVYSFGLTLYEIITRQCPNKRIQEATQKFSSNIYHMTQNQKLAQIVELMLEYEEQNRPDFNQLYEIFKKHFNFEEEDPVHELDGYSDKDLVRMTQHQRRDVINKRSEYQKNMDRKQMQKLKFEKAKIRRETKFQEAQNIQISNNEKEFERKEVYYVDKEMEEEINRRKRRHFANEKVILYQEPTSYTRAQERFEREEVPKYLNHQQNEENYYHQHQRQQERFQQNFEDKTVEIDNTVQNQDENQNNHQQDFNNFNPNVSRTKEIPEQVHQQAQEQQIYQAQQMDQNQKQEAEQQNNDKFDKKNYCLPANIQVISIIMMKQFIICGCKDGSLRIINTTSKNLQNIYRIHGLDNTHEGSPITVITKDNAGNLWTASEDGKVLIWDRMKFFTRLMNQASYSEQTVEILNREGQRELVSLGVVRMDPKANELIVFEGGLKPGITAIHCQDKKNFIIGFNNGRVFTSYNSTYISYHLQSKAITTIKFYEHEIYTASLDGTICIVSMKKQCVRENTFKCPSGIRNFLVSGNTQTPEFFVATVDGCGYKINIQNSPWQVPQDGSDFEPLDIVDSFFANNESAVLLTSNGKILQNGNPLIDLDDGQGESEGWCCMSWDSNMSIAIGNSKGHVCLITAV